MTAEELRAFVMEPGVPWAASANAVGNGQGLGPIPQRLILEHFRRLIEAQAAV